MIGRQDEFVRLDCKSLIRMCQVRPRRRTRAGMNFSVMLPPAAVTLTHLLIDTKLAYVPTGEPDEPWRGCIVLIRWRQGKQPQP